MESLPETPERDSASTRVAKKESTRRALHAAGMRCFGLRGFAATSIAEITAEAGVAKGTFYVHFDSKEALLDESLGAFNAEFGAVVAELVATTRGAPLDTTVRAVADAFLVHWSKHRAFVRAYAERSSAGFTVDALPFGIDPAMRLLLEPILVARFPSMPAPEVPLVVQGLLALYLRLGLQFVFRDDLSRDDVVNVLATMTLGALSSYESRPEVTP